MIENKNTKQRYIGQSIHIYKRWNQHINQPSTCMRIDRAIKKHGADNFELKVICELEQDDDLLNAMEKYYVWKYNTYEDDFHYNSTPGGDFSPMNDSDIKEKHAQIMKSNEVRKKISKAISGESNPMYGKKFSEEHRKKLSESQNTSGYFRVVKHKTPQYKQGFEYRYRYYDDNGKRHAISSVDIKKLEKKVKAKGLEWFKLGDGEN